MKRTWIGSVGGLALAVACAVVLSTAPFGCSQNKGGVTQAKSGCACKKAEGKPCVCKKGEGTCPKDCKCAEKATGECPHAKGKPCACQKGEGTCPKDCKCAEKAAGECPHAKRKPCDGKKTAGN